MSEQIIIDDLYDEKTQIIRFEHVVTNKINQLLNQIKKDIKQNTYTYLARYYAPYIESNKQEQFQKAINQFSNTIAKEITNGDSGISQLLQLVSKHVDKYNDISVSMADREYSEKEISENVAKINKEIKKTLNAFVSKVINGIGVQRFDFETLIDIKGVGWTTLSHLYLAIKDNSSADELYVQGYLEFEVFKYEANKSQKLWLTYSEIRKPLFELINEGIDSYDVHEVTQIANQTIDSILNNQTFVKHIKTSSINQKEPCYASATIYESFYYVFERLSNKIKTVSPLIGTSEEDTKHLDEVIKSVEDEKGFSFTIEQKQAIYASCQHSVFSLTGFAGTGKSTSVKAIMRIYEKLGFAPHEIMGTSFTGQATYNLRQSVGLDSKQCATMHRWIMCNLFVPKEFRPVPSFDDVKLVIIDEFSMVSLELVKWILSLLDNNENVRILFVGDVGQLPAIDLGFAYDFVQSEIGQQIELTQIVRQGEDSIVPKMANEVRFNRVHETLEDTGYKGKNFRFLSRVGQNDMTETASKSYIAFEKKHQDLSEIQVIANTINIVNSINEKTQFKRLENNLLTRENYLHNNLSDEYFYINDRVVVTKNMVINQKGKNIQVFNGAKGTIKHIELANNYFMGTDDEFSHRIGNLISITIAFDNDDLGTIEFELNSGITRHMKLAYATSIHKSQGSTISNVIMVVGRADGLNSAELIYTGLTRTSNTLTLISSANIIKKAIDYSNYANARTIYQDVIKSINQHQ